MITNYPLLYQINTRVWLNKLSQQLGRPATLDDVADAELDQLRDKGFQWIWLLSVWTTGNVGRDVSRSNQGWRAEFQETLPDLQEDDIAGSGFAIAGYRASVSVGGPEALKRFRHRLQKRNLKLMLDFVPNHMAIDHPWVTEHPEYFVAGTKEDAERSPQNYFTVGDKVFAYGRDPYFAGWPDTIQLDYSNIALQQAMTKELLQIAQQCDGVRCDMAMLVLPHVFQKTWNKAMPSFWPEAIKHVRESVPGFYFMAEVYWDLEWEMQQQGFDYAYDKPGLRFFHQGQFEGRLKRISPHLVRGPEEEINQTLQEFYDNLLKLLKDDTLHHGQWHLLEASQAWDENTTNQSLLLYFGLTDNPLSWLPLITRRITVRAMCNFPCGTMSTSTTSSKTN